MGPSGPLIEDAHYRGQQDLTDARAPHTHTTHEARAHEFRHVGQGLADRDLFAQADDDYESALEEQGLSDASGIMRRPQKTGWSGMILSSTIQTIPAVPPWPDTIVGRKIELDIERVIACIEYAMLDRTLGALWTAQEIAYGHVLRWR